MRRVYLLRYATSSWKHPDVPDRDRPLARRGARGEGDRPAPARAGHRAGVRAVLDGSPRARGAGADLLSAEAIPVWLNKPVPSLEHEKPIELIARGHYRRMADVLAGLETATFS